MHLPVCGQLRDHVSYSELRLFSDCEWRWYLSTVAGLRKPERSLQMSFGTAVHSAMELLHSQESPPLDEIDGRALERFDRECEGLILQPHELGERERLRWMIPTIVRDVKSCPELQGIVPLRNELELMVPIDRIDGLNVKFKGFVDFVYAKRLARKTVIYIADFKTCTWGWPYQKLTDPKVCAQILLYKHFFCKLTGAVARDVSAAFILLKKTPPPGKPSVEVAKISAGPKVLSDALDLLQTSITRMHSGTYRKNRESCQRFWKDPVTKEERVARCPFFESEHCPSAGAASVSTGDGRANPSTEP